ncbi:MULTISPECIES: FAD-dependent oxidoreductase [unclassified Colwellia]|uniref:FAD-dependent oxidoreductase n=1 Tax=unclassified Colwellia TaxID=196834 RepID=UPI002174F610|nr:MULTISPECIES: FAD-dependent oxidoreductase [unclassified Colwellia]
MSKSTESATKTKSVAVFGGGISGLTVAHEFSKLGYNVKVFEANSDAGGFFRSARRKEDEGMPSEYSWHGMGPWYNNFFELIKEIPFDECSSLYENILSRPVVFGLAPNSGTAHFGDSNPNNVDVENLFSMTTKEKWLWGWLILKAWCSNNRSSHKYSTINAKEAWRPYLSASTLNTWSSTFGPWVGSDWCNVSFHHVAHFFRKQLVTKYSYRHSGDSEGGPWDHTARTGWLLLNGPSSEVWFDKWINHLMQNQVEFFWQTPLHRLSFEEDKITAAELVNGETVQADIYVLALNPFSAADILARTPLLEDKPELNLFQSLVKQGPHTQVSFRIGFKEKMLWPRKRCALVISDSAFNLTLFSQEQAWGQLSALGEDIKSLWTVTACVSKVPGPVHGLCLEQCTEEQFLDEVLFQLKQSHALEDLVKKANGGKSWTDFSIVKIKVWHEWEFSSEGIKSSQPKWVNSTNTQQYMPKQKTTISNLVLAGAHTKTTADVWSIEAAVESGKLAVKVFEPQVKVTSQSNLLVLKVLGKIDDFLYYCKLPNVLDVGLILIVMLSVSAIAFEIAK